MTVEGEEIYHSVCMHDFILVEQNARNYWFGSLSLREYTEGWTDGIENRDPMLEYRLTIEEAADDDSGSFECITPSRHGHEIKIVVKSELNMLLFFFNKKISTPKYFVWNFVSLK